MRRVYIYLLVIGVLASFGCKKHKHEAVSSTAEAVGEQALDVNSTVATVDETQFLMKGGTGEDFTDETSFDFSGEFGFSPGGKSANQSLELIKPADLHLLSLFSRVDKASDTLRDTSYQRNDTTYYITLYTVDGDTIYDSSWIYGQDACFYEKRIYVNNEIAWEEMTVWFDTKGSTNYEDWCIVDTIYGVTVFTTGRIDSVWAYDADGGYLHDPLLDQNEIYWKVHKTNLPADRLEQWVEEIHKVDIGKNREDTPEGKQDDKWISMQATVEYKSGLHEEITVVDADGDGYTYNWTDNTPPNLVDVKIIRTNYGSADDRDKVTEHHIFDIGMDPEARSDDRWQAFYVRIDFKNGEVDSTAVEDADSPSDGYLFDPAQSENAVQVNGTRTGFDATDPRDKVEHEAKFALGQFIDSEMDDKFYYFDRKVTFKSGRVHEERFEPIDPSPCPAGTEPNAGHFSAVTTFPSGGEISKITRNFYFYPDSARHKEVINYSAGDSTIREVSFNKVTGTGTIYEIWRDGTEVSGTFDDAEDGHGSFDVTITYPSGNDPVKVERKGTCDKNTYEHYTFNELTYWQDNHVDTVDVTADVYEDSTVVDVENPSGTGHFVIKEVLGNEVTQGRWTDKGTGDYTIFTHTRYNDGSALHEFEKYHSDDTKFVYGSINFYPDGSGEGTIYVLENGDWVEYHITIDPDGTVHIEQVS